MSDRSIASRPEARRDEHAGLERRAAERVTLLLDSTCTIAGQRTEDVWLVDISRTGCQLFNFPGPFTPGLGIVLAGEAGDWLKGNVAWVAGKKAGVRFGLAMSQEAFARMIDTRPVSRVVVSDQSQPMVDQFGRPLAPLPLLSQRRNR